MSERILPTMDVRFVPMSAKHGREIIDIYNYYVLNSLSAYPEEALPYEFFDKLLMLSKGFPAYTILSGDKVVGFCFLHAYNPFPTFKESAEISYFIDTKYTGKGIGKAALEKLESGAREMGIKILLASIASENHQSLIFHQKHGFKQCGRFEKIITKKGKQFDIIWMQKTIS